MPVVAMAGGGTEACSTRGRCAALNPEAPGPGSLDSGAGVMGGVRPMTAEGDAPSTP